MLKCQKQGAEKGKYAVVLSVIIAYFFKKSRRLIASASENSLITD